MLTGSLIPTPFVPQVKLTGCMGEYKQYMGVYKLSPQRANDAALFVKDEGSETKHYLFRDNDLEDPGNNGKWRVTKDRSDIAKNVSRFKSSKAASLPSSAGLTWQYLDRKGWHDDPNMRCTAVRPSRDTISRTQARLGWLHPG